MSATRNVTPPKFNDITGAIRMLAVDAVQKANSGHPGAPMGMAEIADVLWNRHLRHNPANPQMARPRPFHPVQRTRLDAGLCAAASVRLRPADGRAEAFPPIAFQDSRATPNTDIRQALKPPEVRSARASPTRWAWRWRKSCWRRSSTSPATRSSTTTLMYSWATAA